jgi:hypothetical protein
VVGGLINGKFTKKQGLSVNFYVPRLNLSGGKILQRQPKILNGLLKTLNRRVNILERPYN